MSVSICIDSKKEEVFGVANLILCIGSALLGACLVVYLLERAEKKHEAATDDDQTIENLAEKWQSLKERTEVPLTFSQSRHLLDIEKEYRVLFFAMPEYFDELEHSPPPLETDKEQERLKFLRWLIANGRLSEYPVEATGD